MCDKEVAEVRTPTVELTSSSPLHLVISTLFNGSLFIQNLMSFVGVNNLRSCGRGLGREVVESSELRDDSALKAVSEPSLANETNCLPESPTDSISSYSLPMQQSINEKAPLRELVCDDALIWLDSFADDSLPGCVFTSLPDISEVPEVAKGAAYTLHITVNIGGCQYSIFHAVISGRKIFYKQHFEA